MDQEGSLRHTLRALRLFAAAAQRLPGLSQGIFHGLRLTKIRGPRGNFDRE